MAIFDISEKTDFLFDQIWRVWPQSWGTKGQDYAESAGKKIIDRMSIDGETWQDELCFAAAATRTWYGVERNDMGRINRIVYKLVTFIQTLFPEYTYISIKVGSNVSGGDGIFCPNIEIGLDVMYFGYTHDGPNNTIHPTLNLHLGHKPDLYYKTFTRGPLLPYPKAKDYIKAPEHNGPGVMTIPSVYYFFPENDPPKGYQPNSTPELLKFQRTPNIF